MKIGRPRQLYVGEKTRSYVFPPQREPDVDETALLKTTSSQHLPGSPRRTSFVQRMAAQEQHAKSSFKKAIPDDDKRDPQRLSKVVERSDSFVKKMEEFARQRTLSEEREHGLLEESLGVDSSGVTAGSGSEEK